MQWIVSEERRFDSEGDENRRFEGERERERETERITYKLHRCFRKGDMRFLFGLYAEWIGKGTLEGKLKMQSSE